MTRLTPYLIAAVLLVGLFLYMQDRERRQAVRFEERAQRVEAAAAVTALQRDSAVRVARVHGATAAAALVRAEAAEQRAADAGRRVQALRAELAAEDSVPEAARPYTDPRDAVIAAQAEQIMGLEVAALDRDEAIHDLRLEVRTLEDIVRNAAATEKELRAALASRPKPRPRIMPRLGLGTVAGYCKDATAGLCGVGLTLSWEL